MSMYQMVKDFHERFGLDVAYSPIDFSHENDEQEPLFTLRQRLHQEEWKELEEAWVDEDLVAYADAICDLIYVLCGTAVSFGIPLDKCFAEVHRSNMSKASQDGTVIRREDGKILKAKTYSEPNLHDIIYAQPSAI